jgi:hypothetical protein
MPHIPNFVADCVVYMYSSERAAERGEQAGGSGFLIHVASKVNPNAVYVYAVTNKHLIDDGFLTLRLNLKGGGLAPPLQTVKDDWFLHENENNDVAVYSIDVNQGFKYWSVPSDTFLDQEMIEVYDIGYGDDVFMVGRLISQSGKEKNTPVIRFGNISLMADPKELIISNGRESEAFLVECRSISGFSGSPVFVLSHRFYREEAAQKVVALRQKRIGFEMPKEGMRFTTVASDETIGPFLLGIDFCHLPHYGSVYNGSREIAGYKAQINTGIAGVVPSWKIVDILNVPKLAEERTTGDAGLGDKQE